MMKRFRFETVLGALLVGFVILVTLWQSPGRRLTPEDIERYLSTVDANIVLPAEEKLDILARLRAFGEGDDGKPVYMLNLMRYYDDLRPNDGIPEGFSGGPGEANAYYEKQITPIALKNGALPLFMGDVHEPNVIATTPEEDNWDRIVVVRYKDRRAFFELLTDPVYAKYAPYKLASLHVGLVPVESRVVVPDPRLLSIAVALIVFAAAGWARASRRTRPSIAE